MSRNRNEIDAEEMFKCILGFGFFFALIAGCILLKFNEYKNTTDLATFQSKTLEPLKKIMAQNGNLCIIGNFWAHQKHPTAVSVYANVGRFKIIKNDNYKYNKNEFPYVAQCVADPTELVFDGTDPDSIMKVFMELDKIRFNNEFYASQNKYSCNGFTIMQSNCKEEIRPLTSEEQVKIKEILSSVQDESAI